MTTSRSTVPDLLRRFTRTPLTARFRIGSVHVSLRTNDPELITMASSFGPPATRGPEDIFFLWKLVREKEISPSTALSLLMTDELNTLLRGERTVISVDRGRREVLGFLAADVSAEELKTIIFPLLAEWCKVPAGSVTRQEELPSACVDDQ